MPREVVRCPVRSFNGFGQPEVASLRFKFTKAGNFTRRSSRCGTRRQ